MSGSLDHQPFSQLSKEQVLTTFKKSLPKNSCIQSLVEIFPDIFSDNALEPENYKATDLNINDAFLDTASTPKPMRLVLQKRVYIPKSPFASSGYADDPTHRVWYYLDEGNNVQGPFTSLEMDFWFDSGFLFNELLIRIKEKNDFVKLIHLFGKTEMIQMYKPAPLSAIDHLYLHQQTEQAPRSADIKGEDPTKQAEKKTLEKKPSIYTFGFDEEESASSPAKSPGKSPGKAQTADSEAGDGEIKKDEVAKSPIRKIEPQERIEEKVQEEKEEKCEQITVIKSNSEVQEEASIQVKKNESSSSTSHNHLEVKEQREDKNLLSPNYKRDNGRNSSKKNSYVEYEPKQSPSAEKAKQELRKNKTREQGQASKQGPVLQYVVKEEKREEPVVTKEWKEKDKNKGVNQQKKNKAQDTQEKVKREGPLNSCGKKGPTVVMFVPKKKDEVIYVEKAKSERKDTYDRMYVPKEAKEDVLPDLQPGSFQRKESDTFEILKATSEYYQNDTTKDSTSGSEDPKQTLPPGLQPDINEPVVAPKSLMKKPKEKLRLLSHPYNDYETEQDRIVATSLGLLDLEEESVPSKKVPTRSNFKQNSATPSPLIIDNGTVGKLYNFSEDLKYTSFGNQTEEFTIRDSQ